MVTAQEALANLAVQKDRLFRMLTQDMRADEVFAQRVTAHVREVTGHNSLVSYASNGASDKDKVALFATLVGAHNAKDYSKLKGTVAVGQAVAPVEPKEEEVKEEPKRVTPAVVKVEPRVTVPGPGAPEAERLLETLRGLIGGQPATVDEGKVLELIAEHTAAFEDDLRKELTGKVTEFLKAIPPREVLEIRAGGAVREVKGLAHWQLPQAITWVSANVPLWLWGGAGAGKTTMARQIGSALGLTPYIISIDPTITVGKLLGFRNLATGEFIPGFLYEPYKNGGVVLLDEIDTGDPGILASTNAILANDTFMFPDGQTIEKHKDFRVVAGGNTRGCGAVAGYTARNRLDAATLDRFAVVELTYDTDLERAVALGEDLKRSRTWAAVTPKADKCAAWVDYVLKVRGKVGTSVLVSPRASILGCRALRAGVPPKEVADALLFKVVSSDTKTNIENQVGRFE